MQKLNNHPLTNGGHAERDKLLMIALWKVNGGQPIKITPEDVQAFSAAFDGMPTMMLHGQVDGITISIMNAGAAVAKAAARKASGK
jgi:hypothetical protein